MEKNIVLPLSKKTWSDEFKFVLRAISKDKKSREILTGVYVTKGKIVATDGKRLHIWSTDLLDETVPEGVYNVSITSQCTVFTQIEGKFPDYISVMPDITKAEKICTVNCVDSIDFSKILTLSGTKDRGYNYYYIEDLGIGKWEISKSKDMIIATSLNLYALIMPFNIKKE